MWEDEEGEGGEERGRAPPVFVPTGSRVEGLQASISELSKINE